MRHHPPSTPQRSRTLPLNTRSPLFRNAASSPASSSTSIKPWTPSLASEAHMLSLAQTGLSALPDPPNLSGVIPAWLTEHLPLPLTNETESVLAALIASRAPLARSHRQQQGTMKYGLSWDWYIKDIPRRKLMYGQITNIIIGLVRLHNTRTHS